ncbi:MAG: DUF748 domain-containing protein, partial [Planctomycetes bacterium]|nr:DUF748 domain-containing protein [Planctomycetota bacterium]
GAAPSEGPALVVRSLALKDAVVHFTDETATEPLPRLVAVTGQVLNLSDAPAAWGQPVEANLSGRVDDENGGRIALEARYDYRQGVLLTQTYALRTEGVEMARLAAFFGRSSAVDLRKGKATSDVKGVMRDGQMDFQVVSDLTGVEVAAKPGVKRLAGLKAEDVVRGVNAVKDFHIAFGVKGSPGSPRFEWGDEIARIITQGGVDAAKAAAMDAAEEAADDAARRASEAADRALGDAVPPGQGGEVVDEAKDRLRRGVGGLFGKDK